MEKKGKYLIKNLLPVGVLLLLILFSEFRTEGCFGGIKDFALYLFFLLFSIAVIITTLIKQFQKINSGTKILEAKIVLFFLSLSVIVAVSSFFFPRNFVFNNIVFDAKDKNGTKLILTDKNYMLKTNDYEITCIDRGIYIIRADTIILEDIKKEKIWSKKTDKYIIKKDKLIPVYLSGIEKDTINYLTITKNFINF